MIKWVAFILVFFLVWGLMPGGNTNPLGGKFEVAYVDNPLYRNLYYNHQGIFANISVNKVIHDKNTILVSGKIFRPAVIDSSTYTYYCINRLQYIDDPSQMDSKGLSKLISKNEFDSLAETLDKPRILSWN